jgi:hypothetical protein
VANFINENLKFYLVKFESFGISQTPIKTIL